MQSERKEWTASLLVHLTQELDTRAELRVFVYPYTLSRAIGNLGGTA